eukprot:COSAG01_NODE_52660_length_345_cov_0.634146_1_plen_63_part_10
MISGACSQLAHALEAVPPSAAAAAPTPQPALKYDAKMAARFPFKLGKYWLGPMDPSKPWNPRD